MRTFGRDDHGVGVLAPLLNRIAKVKRHWRQQTPAALCVVLIATSLAFVGTPLGPDPAGA